MNLAGATNSAYNLAAVSTNDAGNYSVVITNSAGSITSSVASLTVLLPPSILTPPQSQTVSSGANASFTVVAEGSAPLAYFWQFNGGPLAGATSSSLTITNAQLVNQGNYTVVVSNAVGAITSPAAHLTVQTATSNPLQIAGWAASSGTFGFDVTSPILTNVVIWSSADLRTWTPVSTNFSTTGTVHFSDTNAADPASFYRATLGR